MTFGYELIDILVGNFLGLFKGGPDARFPK